MEETTSENSSLDVPPDAENIVDDQQEVSYVTGQGWQYKNINPNPNQKEGENPQSEAALLSDEDTEQSAETDPTPATTPVEPVPLREYAPKVPNPVPAKKSRKDHEEMKFL
ncbi:hypothetical protein F2Q68_00026182 [Brassica cretica]|uniref:Uncharacterized protein n=1 Tax=Brassica cretica TaxID=69181 RepID=A0A8S9I951_BRACR|nr:hypothetical protein F2Q68_00026182 [Brassica cretica]